MRCLVPLSKAYKEFATCTFGPAPVLESYKDKKIDAVEDVYQFSSGNRVGENRTNLGKVIGFSESPDYMQNFDSWFPFEYKYVWLENEKNPKSYQKYAVKVDDFLNWIQEGKYVVPTLNRTKELPKSLDDVINKANVLSKEQLMKKAEHSFER